MGIRLDDPAPGLWLRWTLACTVGAGVGYVLATLVAVAAGYLVSGSPLAVVGLSIGLVVGAIWLGACQAWALRERIPDGRGWVVATACGVAIPAAVALVVGLLLAAGTIDPRLLLRQVWIIVLAPILGGGLVGAAQAFTIRHRTPRARLWVWVSTLGVVIGLIAGQLLSFLFLFPLGPASRGASGAILSSLVFGLVFGVVYGMISGLAWPGILGRRV